MGKPVAKGFLRHKGKKNGIPLYPNLVNLKSNTMKNTMQRYGGFANPQEADQEKYTKSSFFFSMAMILYGRLCKFRHLATTLYHPALLATVEKGETALAHPAVNSYLCRSGQEVCALPLCANRLSHPSLFRHDFLLLYI